MVAAVVVVELQVGGRGFESAFGHPGISGSTAHSAARMWGSVTAGGSCGAAADVVAAAEAAAAAADALRASARLRAAAAASPDALSAAATSVPLDSFA